MECVEKIHVWEMLSIHIMDSVFSLHQKEVKNTLNYLYNRAGFPMNVAEQMFMSVLNVISCIILGGTVKSEDRETLGGTFQQPIN
ncbi:hypothetical protein Hanom_Chr17g01558391 [Helianthus anomalus]